MKITNLIGCLWNQTLFKLIRGVTVFLRSYGLKENLGLVCSEVPLSPPVFLCLSDSLSSLQSCIFALSWRGNILSNASIHNLRSFVRSKGKKEWTEAKCVESFNIWGAALYLGQLFCWPLCSTGWKKKWIQSDLFKVAQCESEKIGHFNARQSWYLSLLKRCFCMWLVSIPKSKHDHSSYISSCFFLRREGLGCCKGKKMLAM